MKWTGKESPPLPAIRFRRLMERLPDLTSAGPSGQEMEKKFAKESLEMIATIANNHASSNVEPSFIPAERITQRKQNHCSAADLRPSSILLTGTLSLRSSHCIPWTGNVEVHRIMERSVV
jgi:hypothetical protein